MSKRWSVEQAVQLADEVPSRLAVAALRRGDFECALVVLQHLADGPLNARSARLAAVRARRAVEALVA